MNAPSTLGVDSTGNIWVASYFSAVTEFSPTGSLLSGANGYTGGGLAHTYGLAIDAQNNAWVTNEDTASSVNNGNGSITVLNSSGQPVSGATGYASGGLNYPTGVAIDTNATAWVVNYGNSHVTLLSSSGQPLSGATGYTTPYFDFPIAVAIDGSHNGWVANLGETGSGSSVTKVSPDGTQFTNISCCDGAAALAFDLSGNLWVANYYGDSISQISASGTVVSSGYTGGGLNHPQGVAVDGSGSIWVANFRGPSITKLAGSAASSPGLVLSPSTGFAPDAKLLEAYSVAVDPSGNLWVTGFGDNSLTEFVGLASPLKTPVLTLPKAP
jgi:streptogramin lyase